MAGILKFASGLLALVCILSFQFDVPLWADTLELKEGTILQGRYRGGTQSSIRFEADGILTEYPLSEVLAVTFDSSRNAPPLRQAKVKTTQPGTASASSSVVVPAGTRLLVRLSDALDSREHTAGHRFAARLEADLTVRGILAAPRNATAYGRLVGAKQAGRLTGKSELTLVLTDLLIDNRLVSIRTDPMRTITEKGSGRNTVGKTTRGAAIGGLIDGSDGARTGAKVGLGAAVLTRGQRLSLPAGALLEFVLLEPIRF